MTSNPLAREFGVTTLLLQGGGRINGGFLKAGLIDEISILVSPGIDGLAGVSSIFEFAGAPGERPAAGRSLRLIGSETLPGGTVWLRYQGEADWEVRLPPWWAQEDHVFASLDEAELVQAFDLIPPQRGLKREVEVVELLDRRRRLERMAACSRRLLRSGTCTVSSSSIASGAVSAPPSMSRRIASSASRAPGMRKSGRM